MPAFNWIFALVIGAIILFLAIFASLNIMKTSKYRQDTISAAQLDVLLNPYETGFTLAKTITLSTESSVSLTCDASSGIGKQGLTIGSSSKIGSAEEKGAVTSIYNKYIFSEKQMQGKNLYLFSKQLEMPFKVADILCLTTETYCFIKPPVSIREELEEMNLTNIEIADNTQDCTGKEVCFSGNCDILVNTAEHYVKKQGKTLTYMGDALLYAAVFSSPEIYTCNIKRILKRLSLLSELYYEKTQYLKAKCGIGEIENKLIELKLLADSLSKQANPNLIILQDLIQEISDLNELYCPAYD